MATPLIFRAVGHCSWTLSSVVFDSACLAVLATRFRGALVAENIFLHKQLALFQERKVRPRRAED